MQQTVKAEKVIVSACLLGEYCRYDDTSERIVSDLTIFASKIA
jgi:uncharacterized protein YbbK (DUF523 family)